MVSEAEISQSNEIKTLKYLEVSHEKVWTAIDFGRENTCYSTNCASAVDLIVAWNVTLQNNLIWGVVTLLLVTLTVKYKLINNWSHLQTFRDKRRIVCELFRCKSFWRHFFCFSAQFKRWRIKDKSWDGLSSLFWWAIACWWHLPTRNNSHSNSLQATSNHNNRTGLFHQPSCQRRDVSTLRNQTHWRR